MFRADECNEAPGLLGVLLDHGNAARFEGHDHMIRRQIERHRHSTGYEWHVTGHDDVPVAEYWDFTGFRYPKQMGHSAGESYGKTGALGAPGLAQQVLFVEAAYGREQLTWLSARIFPRTRAASQIL